MIAITKNISASSVQHGRIKFPHIPKSGMSCHLLGQWNVTGSHLFPSRWNHRVHMQFPTFSVPFHMTSKATCSTQCSSQMVAPSSAWKAELSQRQTSGRVTQRHGGLQRRNKPGLHVSLWDVVTMVQPSLSSLMFFQMLHWNSNWIALPYFCFISPEL